MSYIYSLRKIVAGIEVLFERQDVTKAVKIFAHVFDTAFFPSPKLRRDVVDVEKPFAVSETRYSKVESRVVNIYNSVRVELEYVLFTKVYILSDSAKVSDHFDKTHDSKVADMTYGLASNLRHGITAPETKLGLSILPFYGTHEVGTMKVARSFACYYVVFHCILQLLERDELVFEHDPHKEHHGDEEGGNDSLEGSRIDFLVGIVA